MIAMLATIDPVPSEATADVGAWMVLGKLTLLLVAALVLGTLAERLKQNAILGYLLAGTLLGPNALQFVHRTDVVELLAEMGVALLLFSIGLEFSFRTLRRMGRSAILGGALQIVATFLVAAAIALPLIGALNAAVAVGAIVALSSTACVLRVLTTRAEMESMHGRAALGILLVQDLALVPLVLLLSIMSLHGSESGAADALMQAGLKILLAIGLVGGFWILFNYLVPWLLGTKLMHHNRELPIILAVASGIGSATLSHSVGLSPALGAFIVGIILAESPFAHQIRADVSALRTLLLVIFFSSIGMFGNPAWMLSNWMLVVVVVIAIVVGKTAIIWAVMWAMRQRTSTAIATGIALAQVGEFSFVLAITARGGNLIDQHLFQVLVSAAIVTLFLTPLLAGGAATIGEWVAHRLRAIRGLDVADGDDPHRTKPPLRDHLIIVGFGPAGQVVGEKFLQQSHRVLVLDLNRKLVTTARKAGFRGRVGDAAHAEILEHAGVMHASALVITVPDPASVRAIILLARSMRRDLFIIARVRYHIYRSELEEAGADVLLDEESRVGLLLAAAARRHMRSQHDSDAVSE